MKKFLLGVTGALAMGAISCEKHPLPGEPPAPMTQGAHRAQQTSPVTGEQHPGRKSPDATTARDEGAQPAQQPSATDPAKPAEPRKFFPESAEKK